MSSASIFIDLRLLHWAGLVALLVSLAAMAWPVSAQTPTAPLAPAFSTVEERQSEIFVTWSAPSNGGSAITAYRVELKRSTAEWNGAGTKHVVIPVGETLEATFDRLRNGTVYDLRILATNSVGDSEWTTAQATPNGRPLPPDLNKIEGGRGFIRVVLQIPGLHISGGHPITGFRYEWKRHSISNPNAPFDNHADVPGDVNRYTITGLTSSDDHEYVIRFRSSNRLGNSDWIQLTQMPARGFPGEPTVTSVEPGDGTLTINWTPPENDGGLNIIEYRIRYREASLRGPWGSNPGEPSVIKLQPTVRSHQLSGLTNGVEYRYVIWARNTFPPNGGGARLVGTATPGVSTAPIEPGNTPDKPTITDVHIHPDSLSVTWEAPDDNGGSDIEGYKIQWRDSNTEFSSVSRIATVTSGLTHTITDLSNDTTYYVQVTAYNANGDGTPSESWQGITGAHAPVAPTITGVSSGNEKLTVSWSAPTDIGGADISSYDVAYKLSTEDDTKWRDVTRTDTDTSLTQLITPLGNDILHNVRVRAVNSAGNGDWASTTGTPTATVPGAPTITSVSPGNQKLTVTWSAPADNGGVTVTSYDVEYKLSTEDDTKWKDVTRTDTDTSLTQLITPLGNDILHDVRVRAVNSVGNGDWASSTGTPTTTAPGAPTITGVSPGNQKLTVTWSAPAHNGGATVTSYDVEYKLSTEDDTKWKDVTRTDTDTSLTQVITPLGNDILHDVRVRAVNSVGNGDWASTTGTPSVSVTAPGAPTIDSVTPGNEKLTVSWSAPTDIGGAEISGYRVEWKLSTAQWIDADHADLGDDATDHEITGLTNNDAYDVRVRAVNSVDNGDWASATGTPTPTVPGAPTKVKLTPGNKKLTVTWSAPTDNGGAVITSYNVEYQKVLALEWTDVERGDTDTSTIQVITQLENGQFYNVRVTAVNSVGPGKEITLVERPTTTAPGVPAITGVSPGNEKLTVTWSAPADNGGVTVTSYDVEYKLSTEDDTKWRDVTRTDTDTSLTQVISPLDNDILHDVRVRAVNSVGDGDWAATTGTPTTTAPGAPTITSVSPGNQKLTVTWSEPADSGGAAITSYDVEYKLSTEDDTQWRDVTRTDTDTSLTQVISPLDNDILHDVRVRAVNSVGDGDWASTTGTPSVSVTAPGAPTIDSVTPGDEKLTVSWSAPTDNGGEEPTSYDVEYKLSTEDDTQWMDVTRTDTDTSTTQVIDDLDNGMTYDVRVRAVNSADNGTWASDDGTPATKPDSPTIDSVTAGNGTLTMAWSAPTDNGGADISGYRVEWKLSTAQWTDAEHADMGDDATGHEITGLTNNSAYDVRVRAVNSAGDGDWASTTGTPTATVPDAPTITVVTPGNGELTVTWSEPANNGGAAITSYDVGYKLSTEDDTKWRDVTRTDTDTSLTQVISPLDNDILHDVRVRAVNSVGDGDWASTTGTPLAARVARVQVTDTSIGNATARVFLSNIRSANTVYFRFGFRTQNRWFSTQKNVAAGQTYADFQMNTLVPFLQANLSLDVEASLDDTFPAGSATASYTSTSAVTTVAGAPTITNVDQRDSSLTVHWTAPGNTGGAVITSYDVEYKLTTEADTQWRDVTRTDTDTSLTQVIDELDNGTGYDVQVRAINPRGGGAWAAGTGTPGSTATAPSAPVRVSVSAGHRTLAISWGVPTDLGGAEISAYRVEWKLSTAEWADAEHADLGNDATGHEITGLTNNSAYDVRIRAVNSAGDGDWASTTGTPTTTAPGAPTITGVSPGNGTATISWSAPDNGGAEISGYRVEWKETGLSWLNAMSADLAMSATTYQITDLNNNKAYDVRVRAANSVGAGDWAEDTVTLNAVAPDAPTIIGVTPGDRTLTVKWSRPTNNGGSPITGYRAEWKLNSNTWTSADGIDLAGTAITYTISGLQNGSSYDVRVRAANSVDNGAWAQDSGTPSTARVTRVQVTDTSVGNATARIFIADASSVTNIHFRFGNESITTWPSTSVSVPTGGTYVDVNMQSMSAILTAGATMTAQASLENTFPNTRTASTTFTVTSAVTTPPGVPTIDSVTPGESKLTASWTAPASNGGATITAYEVQYKETDESLWRNVTRAGADDSTTQEITPLDNGKTYDVRVRAVNPRGEGDWASRTGTRAGTATPPGAPTIDSVTSGDLSLTVVWTAPADDGGEQITSYDVEYKKSVSGNWTDTERGDTDDSTTHTITTEDNDILFDVRVRASNSVGDGEWTEVTEVRTGTPPGAPTIESVAPGDGMLTVTWREPEQDGGVPISGYRIEWKQKIATSWTGQDLAEDVRSHAISSLSNDTEYDLQLAAINAIDTGTFATATGTPGVVPGVPVIVSVEPGDVSLTVTWLAPSDTGSSALTGYRLEWKKTAEADFTDGQDFSETVLSHSISGLENGTEYTVQVRAVNSTGGGGWATSTSVPGMRPGAPSISSVERGDGSLTIAWAAPADTGSSALTGYRLEWKKTAEADFTDGQDFSETVLSHSISGLENGTEYTVQVKAINVAGSSAWATSAGTPGTVPGAPVISDTTPGDGEIAVTWVGPGTLGGFELTGYKVQWKAEGQEYNETDRLDEVDDQTTSHTISGLANGAKYMVRVLAVNAVGDSAPAESDVSLIDVPNPPTNVRLTRGAGELVVEWDASATDELHPVLAYMVRWKSDAEEYDAARALNVASTALTATIPGLTNGIAYTVKVQATNDRGESANSNEPNERPGANPGAPRNLSVTPAHNELVLEWEEPDDTGGFDIIAYKVQWKSGAQEYGAPREASVTVLTYTITDLSPDVGYVVRVLAVTDIGETESPPEVETTTSLDPSIAGLSVPDGGDDITRRTTAVATVTIANRDDRQATAVYLRYSEDIASPIWSTVLSEETNEDSVEIELSGLSANTNYLVQASLDDTFPAGGIANTTFLTASTVPDTPTAITLTPSDRAIQVTWAAPGNGGSDITGYTVEWEPQAFDRPEEITVAAGTLTHTISTIGNGLLYNVVVKAINGNGESLPSAPVVGASSTRAQEPENVVVDRGGSGELVVRWSTPANDGHSPISGYVVQWKLRVDVFDEQSPVAELGEDARNHTITGLTNGVQYDVRVFAVNGHGRGEPSAPVRIIPGVVAGAPTGVVVTHGDGRLTVAWQPPSGGVTPDSYTVQWKPSTAQLWASSGNAESPHTVGGLTNGVQHDVRIIAVKDGLLSSPSGVASGTPSTFPGAPTDVVLTPGDSEMTVNWNEPNDNGGASISAYIIQWKPNTTPSWIGTQSANDTAPPHIIVDLENDKTYDVRIFALNLNGPGTPSQVASASPVGLALAGISTVTIAEGTITSVSATVTVTIANQDEEPETVHLRYRQASVDADWTEVGKVDITTETSVDFSLDELDAYTEYEVEASLDSDFPEGASPGTTFLTASTVPDAPVNLIVIPGDEELSVSWSPPDDDGGASISAYIVQWKPNATPSWIGAQSANDTAPPYIIVDLENDKTYDVRVIALNLNGPGTPSPVASASPVGLALAGISTVTVVEETITSDGATITVTIVNQDEEPETVHLRYRPASVDADWTEVGKVDITTETSVDFSLDELDAYTEYEVEASLDSDFPEGASPGTTFVTLSTVPDAPVNLIVIPGDEELSVSWSPPDDDGGASISAYIVQWRPEGQEFDESRQKEIVATTGIITDLSNGIEYQVRVFALNENGVGNPTDVQVGTPMEIVVPAISGLSASDVTDTDAQIDVTIANQTEGPETVHLRYRPVLQTVADWSPTLSVNIDSETSVEFTLSGLTDNTEYEVQASLDHSFQADTTQSITFTTTEATVSPITPTIMEVTAGDGELTVLWTAPDALEVTGYDLRYIRTDEDNEEDENWTFVLNLQGTPPPVVDECVIDLGTLSADVSESGDWTGDCESENRSGSYARFYTFTLDEPMEVQIDVTSEEDTYLFLLDGGGRDGDVNAENDDVDRDGGDFDSRVTVELEAGTYTIEATTYDAATTGGFTLAIDVETVEEAPVAPPPLPVVDECVIDLGTLSADVSESGEWVVDCASENRSGSYARFYTFTLDEPVEVQIDLTSEEDPYLFLLDGGGRDGDVKAENDDVDRDGGDFNSRVTVELEAGTYTIEATTYGAATTGDFTLTIDVVEPEVAPSGLSMEGNRSSADGRVLSEHNVLRYTLTGLTNGVEYYIQVRAVTGASAGEWSASATAMPGATDTAPPPEVVDECVIDLGTLSADVSESGDWTGDCESENRSGSYARFYTFTIDEPVEVQIDLTSEEDPYLFLLDGGGRDGDVNAENDDVDRDGGDFNSRVTVELEAGTYTIEATTYGAATTGGFTLAIDVETVEEAPVAPPPPPVVDECVIDLGTLSADVSESGEWVVDCASENRSGSYARFYTFTLDEPVEVQIDLTSEEDPYLFLLDGGGRDGDVNAENDDVDRDGGDFNSRVTVELEAGTYTIEATTYGAATTGDFTLTIDVETVEEAPVAPPPPPLVDECVIDLGTLSADVSESGEWTDDCASENRSGSYARFYTFTLDESAEVQIDLTSEEDPYLFLLDGAGRDGDVNAENDDVDRDGGDFDSRVTVELEAGTYTIEATTYGAATTGDFTLTIGVMEPEVAPSAMSMEGTDIIAAIASH